MRKKNFTQNGVKGKRRRQMISTWQPFINLVFLTKWSQVSWTPRANINTLIKFFIVTPNAVHDMMYQNPKRIKKKKRF